jgi:ribose 5-phosphate isomerase A
MGDVDAKSAARVRAINAAAAAALRFMRPDAVIGVGSGRTAAAFVAALAHLEERPAAAVASSLATEELLRAVGIEVAELPPSGRLSLYVDGADAADGCLRLLKGGGGAHAREKVLATASDLFVCIVDDAKPTESLAGHPVSVEVLPMAVAFVTRELSALGRVATRDGFLTDNGNRILEVSGIDLSEPEALECRIECVPGVVACGVFARRPADVLIIGHADRTVSERLR